MDAQLQHIFHEHPLILKAEARKINDDIDHSELEISCEGCLTPILGPFYSCLQCPYFLHKVCAELPNELKHPIHEHPLCLLSKFPAIYNACTCDMCYKTCKGFIYRCSICDFDVDTICAATSHTIIDKCHMHPLIPIQTPSSFLCHICLNKEEGVSYKCTICPFWVHQNCIVLPDTVKHGEHRHLLTLLPSVPFKYCRYSKKCDICYDKLFPFQCSYYCEGCKFFAHIHCGRSETSLSLSRSRDQDTSDDGQSPVLLPMKQHSTDLISWFVKNYIDGDANKDNKINHISHEHPLLLFDEETTDKTCEACALPISPPSYGCVKCDYFLHKCCSVLPKKIRHPLDPEHQLVLRCTPCLFWCKFCRQLCNLFNYVCSQCDDLAIDIKCASLQRIVYLEAHKHPLVPRINSSSSCTACGFKLESIPQKSEYILKCNTCSFELCFRCAMAPLVIKHRYGKSEPFKLTYFPPENHDDDEYICELCLRELNPKLWHYHCVYADQFIHIRCMLNIGADSNIKYGKSFKSRYHKHEFTTISCTYDCSPCSVCRRPLKSGVSVGVECKTCNFKRHT